MRGTVPTDPFLLFPVPSLAYADVSIDEKPVFILNSPSIEEDIHSSSGKGVRADYRRESAGLTEKGGGGTLTADIGFSRFYHYYRRAGVYDSTLYTDPGNDHGLGNRVQSPGTAGYIFQGMKK